MTNLYHGTSIEHAIDIAKSGALLSPLDIIIQHNKNLKPYYHNSILEAQARKEIEKIYQDHQRYIRAECISLTPYLDIAQDHAARYELYNGGVILEFSVSHLPPQWHQGCGALYVPRELPLQNHLQTIQALFFTTKAWEDENFNRVTDAFDHYNVDYFHLNQINNHSTSIKSRSTKSKSLLYH